MEDKKKVEQAWLAKAGKTQGEVGRWHHGVNCYMFALSDYKSALRSELEKQKTTTYGGGFNDNYVAFNTAIEKAIALLDTVLPHS